MEKLWLVNSLPFSAMYLSCTRFSSTVYAIYRPSLSQVVKPAKGVITYALAWRNRSQARGHIPFFWYVLRVRNYSISAMAAK